MGSQAPGTEQCCSPGQLLGNTGRLIKELFEVPFCGMISIHGGTSQCPHGQLHPGFRATFMLLRRINFHLLAVPDAPFSAFLLPFWEVTVL